MIETTKDFSKGDFEKLIILRFKVQRIELRCHNLLGKYLGSKLFKWLTND